MFETLLLIMHVICHARSYTIYISLEIFNSNMKRRGEFTYMLYCHSSPFQAYLLSFSNVCQARNTFLKQIIQARLRLLFI